MDPRLEKINQAAAYVKEILDNEGLAPKIGIVLGSGLGRLSDNIETPVTIPYKNIPGFPVSTAIGHKGNFIVGSLAGKTVIAMQGRLHYYEGYDMDMVVLPIRVMKVLGIEYLFVSNAAGGVNMSFQTGDLMIITDHINQIPNPLIGPNLDEFGPRFPDMTRPYDPRLIAMAEEIGKEMGLNLRKGVYFACTGPTYETPHEGDRNEVVVDQLGANDLCRALALFGRKSPADRAHPPSDVVFCLCLLFHGGYCSISRAQHAKTKTVCSRAGTLATKLPPIMV